MAEYNPSKIIKDGNTYNFTDNTKIPLTGTNALAGSIIPSTDNTYDFGSSTYKIRYVYAGTIDVTNLNINGTAAGDILTHNASEFVNVTTAQTIGGIKTFSGNIKFTSTATIEKSTGDVELLIKNSAIDATSVSANAVDDIRFTDSSDRITGSMRIAYDTSNGVTVMVYARSYSADGSTSSTNGLSITSNQQTGAARANLSANLLPNSTDTYDLGTTTNKWKTLNGVSPGALSLSNIDSYISIDTSQWDVTLSNNILGSFTPAVDGWVLIQLNPINADTDIWIIGGNMRTNYKTTVNLANNTKFIMCYFPVVKGYTYNIYGHNSMPLSAVSIARLYSCQGNV